jgi:hypothetical protein
MIKMATWFKSVNEGTFEIYEFQVTKIVEIDYDNAYYSKSYHRQYGPKKTVTARYITGETPWGNFKLAVPSFRKSVCQKILNNEFLRFTDH